MEIAHENKTLSQERAQEAPVWILAHLSTVVLFEDLGEEKSTTLLLLLQPDVREAFASRITSRSHIEFIDTLIPLSFSSQMPLK